MPVTKAVRCEKENEAVLKVHSVTHWDMGFSIHSGKQYCVNGIRNLYLRNFSIVKLNVLHIV